MYFRHTHRYKPSHRKQTHAFTQLILFLYLVGVTERQISTSSDLMERKTTKERAVTTPAITTATVVTSSGKYFTTNSLLPSCERLETKRSLSPNKLKHSIKLSC